MGEAPAAERPAPLLEVLPQERVQLRTAEQNPVPFVPLLHAFVPQMVEQLVDILAPLDFRVAEQVIEVPKIVCPPRAARTVLGVPQTVEQLVEARTIVSLIEVIRQPVEQPVDIPVPHGGPHLQDPGLASLPHEVAGEAVQGFFSTLSRWKKCEAWSALGVGTALRVEPIHANSSF